MAGPGGGLKGLEFILGRIQFRDHGFLTLKYVASRSRAGSTPFR
jgi:hypothetical protein